jgi:hypothetical protein
MSGNLVMVAEAFARTAEAAVSAFENRNARGMQVPYHGDFANANPSIIVRLRWWAREFRTALAAAPRPETPPGEWVALCNEQSDWGNCDRPKGHDPAWMHCHGAHGWISAEFQVVPAAAPRPSEAPAPGRTRCVWCGKSSDQLAGEAHASCGGLLRASAPALEEGKR